MGFEISKYVPWPTQPRQERVLYGFGKQEEEEKCSSIHEFLRCVGHVSKDMQHVIHPPHVTIETVRKEFAEARTQNGGREMTQPVVLNERNYAMDPRILHKPLSAFSNNCKLNLDFAYQKQGTDISVDWGETLMDTGKGVVGWIGKGAVSTVSWIGNKFKSSSQPEK